MQSKRASLVEALANVVSGFLIAMALNYVLLHLLGYKIKVSDTFWLTFWFTAASFLRGYTIRRIFNWWDNSRVWK